MLTKTERQSEGLTKFRNAKGIGTFAYPPGFGKTRLGMLLAEEHINFMRKQNKDTSVWILTPNAAIYDHWKENVSEFFNDVNKSYISIFTADYMITNDVKDKCVLLIVDEIHKFITDKRLPYIDGSKLQRQFIVGLTGTYVGELDTICPKIDYISEGEAITNGWISKYLEFNLGLELPLSDRVIYDRHTTYIRDVLDRFRNVPEQMRLTHIFPDHYNLIQSCFSGKKTLVNNDWRFIPPHEIREQVSKFMGWHRGLNLDNSMDAEIDKYWNPNYLQEYVSNFNEAVRKRNTLINTHPLKINTTLDIYNLFGNVKAIVFSESTQFADSLWEHINFNRPDKPAALYHSAIESRFAINSDTGDYHRYVSGDKKGLPKKFGKALIKKDAINGLADGRYKIICTAKAMDEGVDITDLVLAVITSGTCNTIQQYQRGGRAKRLDFNNPNGFAYIVNLYFKDTRDQQKLKLRQKGAENASNVLWIDSLDEIKEHIK